MAKRKKLLGAARCNVCGATLEVVGEPDELGRVEATCKSCKTQLTCSPMGTGETKMATAKKKTTKKTAAKKAAPARKSMAKKTAAKAAPATKQPRASTVWTQKKGNKSWVEHRSVKSAFEALDLPLGSHQAFRKELKLKGELEFADSGITFQTVAKHAA